MKNYFATEVAHAVENLRAGHQARHTLHSTHVLVAAIQQLRAEAKNWGTRFRRDPRRFSSTPRMASAERVSAFIESKGSKS